MMQRSTTRQEVAKHPPDPPGGKASARTVAQRRRQSIRHGNEQKGGKASARRALENREIANPTNLE